MARIRTRHILRLIRLVRRLARAVAPAAEALDDLESRLEAGIENATPVAITPDEARDLIRIVRPLAELARRLARRLAS